MSWPLSCGVGRNIGAEKGTSQNSYRSVVGFHGKLLLSRGWLPRARVWPLSCGVGRVIEAEKRAAAKIPTAAQ